MLIHQIFLKKVYLASLKSDVDKFNIGKLKSAPTDLSKLSNEVENDVAKKQCMMNF